MYSHLLLQSMLEKGARGFVSKVNLSNQLLLAIRAVYEGVTYLCPGIASELGTEE